jgi:2-dehydropantoate 2-reductase
MRGILHRETSVRLLILGAGAVGGYFGARLQEGGVDVTFLVRPKRAEILRERGLRAHGVGGELQIQPQLIVSGERDTQPFDAIIVSCKAYDLDDAIASIRPYVGPSTSIVPLLNGMRHLEALDAAFGAQRVLGGLAQVSTTIDSNGDIQQFTDVQNVFYGARSDQQRAAAEAFDRAIRPGRFTTRLSSDIALEMWEKFVLLCALASTTCLLRAKIGEIVATNEGSKLVLRTLDDCAAIARAAGHAPRPHVLKAFSTILTQAGSPLEASMRRDLEAGGRTEAEHIIGDMIARADAVNIDAPVLRAAYVQLQAHEARRAANQ